MVVGQPGKLVPVYSGCGFKSHPRRFWNQSFKDWFFVARKPADWKKSSALRAFFAIRILNQ